ncbi:2-oxo acid dehydrogenase subunit E2 [Nocardia sp. SYP-A9097]|uniref:dihydrolipoamide acetyltransferase family protein n=1 Tax=Nocardia sp. SYP-A9097 TaxID=2663237 RepID=UPI00129A43E2|nr:dihydrolipoamide acetyltransferase family protein [Nocardia sp. SYP-A9097]MRH88898.1 2-oxo acid dehydrogenase subunit E2 [Nocardia sp. SYP-A9097]
MEFALPDLGEGLADAELVSWTVQVGDTVELNQVIAEVETAKARVALPSPYAGTVLELLASPGDTVLVGAPLIRIGSALTAQQVNADTRAERLYGSTDAQAEQTAASPDAMSRSSAQEAPAERQSVLVGYGPDTEQVSRRARTAASKLAAPVGESTAGSAFGTDMGRPAATPGARKLAREIGVDLSGIAGSGPEGAVTVDDLRTAGGRAGEHIPIHTAPPVPPMHAMSGPRATPAERETRTPITGIRKRTAAAMVSSAQHIPQASTFVTTDFTGSMELLDHLRATPTFAGLTLTPLALVAKATLVALTEFPELNSSWDEANQEIITKHYVNLGIAVATERGLMVPNLKDAHSHTLRDLCMEIGDIAHAARSGSATPADLTGGTFTITNIGVFGVDTGVPLVNPGEAAILCLGSIRKRPWVHRDELAIRWVTTLGLSFDHRLMDGEQGSRFLANIAALLEDPLTLLGRV